MSVRSVRTSSDDQRLHRVLVRVDQVVLDAGREVGEQLLVVVGGRVDQLDLDAGEASDLLGEELILLGRLAADDGAEDAQFLALERELGEELVLRGREVGIDLAAGHRGGHWRLGVGERVAPQRHARAERGAALQQRASGQRRRGDPANVRHGFCSS